MGLPNNDIFNNYQIKLRLDVPVTLNFSFLSTSLEITNLLNSYDLFKLVFI